MRRILYWSSLILAAILLAYISPFNLTPIIFLGGAFVIAGGYFSFLSHRRRRSGVWEHGTHQFRFVGSVILYVMVYWTTVGLFTNVKEQREFLARYEPYIQEGRQHGFTFSIWITQGPTNGLTLPSSTNSSQKKIPNASLSFLKWLRISENCGPIRLGAWSRFLSIRPGRMAILPGLP